MLLEGDPLAEPAAPLNFLLQVGIESNPDDVALVSVYRTVTWRELEHESAALARGYLTIGLNPGDRIASLMPNRIALISHYLACWRAGLIATPLNYRYTFREIDHALEVSGARALLAHVERIEDVEESQLAGELSCGVIGYTDPDEQPTETGWRHSFGDLLEAEPLKPDGPAPDPQLPAVIFFTSGSTGPAKGVTHTRASIRWMIASAAAAFELQPGDAFLPGSSMSH